MVSLFLTLTMSRSWSDQPCVMNRIVRMDILNSYEEEDYAMGDRDIRENLLIWNTRTEKRPEAQTVPDMPCKEEVTLV